MKENQQIRLFVDAHVFDGQYQGTRTFIKGIYDILIKRKDILVFLGAYDIDNLKKDFTEADNVTFIKYKSTSGFIRLVYDIPSIIKKYKIEYAHFQYILPPVKKCRYIVTIHDVIFHEYPEEFSRVYRIKKYLLYKISAIRADIVTTVSDYSKNSIQKYLGVKPGLIYVVPNGVSSFFFDNYNKYEAREFVKKKYGFDKFILLVSRIEPRKNHVLLLRAYLDLKLYMAGYYLVLLGHKSIRASEFDELLDQLPQNIKQFIFINGDVNDTDLLQFYRAASVFVYPSRAEGFGIPPLEAAALKVPVICSNSSAMKDFSFFEEYHIDPANYDLFKEKLGKMIESPPGEARLNTLSAIIYDRYSWEVPAERFYQVILKDKTINFAHSSKIQNRND